MKSFDHVAMLSERERPGEVYSDLLKVWVVSPDNDPHRVEWVRIAPESPLRDTPLARMPHVAWRVDDLDSELQDKEVVYGPIEVGDGLRVAFFLMNGALIEYMESKPQQPISEDAIRP